jgi:signal transduction histidine kinase/CheY-like chemotaxis protein
LTQIARVLPAAMCIGALFGLLAYAGIALTREHERVAALWLPNAMLVAVLLRGRSGRDPAYIAAAFIGNLTANLIAGDHVAQAVALSLCNALEVLLVLTLVRRFCGARPDMADLHHLIVFSLAGGFIAPMASGLAAMLLLGLPAFDLDLNIWLRWAAADGLGMLIVAPALMIFADRWTDRHVASGRSLTDWILIMGCGAAISALPFLHVKLPAFFLAGPFVILVAFRLGTFGTAVAVVGISIVATTASTLGFGIIQLIETDLSGRLLILQGFLVAIFGMSLPVAAALSGRDRLRVELERARAQAEAADHAKSTFLANISHEIRTPMSGVIGFTDLLLASDLDDTQRRNARLIAESGSAMMRLLGDVLDISKVEVGEMTIAREDVDIAETLDACIKLLTPAAEQQGIILQGNFDPDLPALIAGDRLRISQIVLNLIGNALKFTDHGFVNLNAAVRKQDDQPWLEIAVQDTGIGIAAEELAHIFDEFVQLGPSGATREGAGLGLAISKRLARLMGGEISVKSSPGKGSVFSFRMSVQTRQVVAPVKAKDAGAMPAAPRSASVLVAEDSGINQALLDSMLTTLGHRVTIVSNGSDAVVAATEAVNRFDLLLMDIRMPGMNGIEACNMIRKVRSPESLPIIAMTANAFATDAEASLAAGMQDHVTKPIRLNVLNDVISRWVGLERAEPLSLPQSPDPVLTAKYQARRAATLNLLGSMIREGRLHATGVEELAHIAHQLAGVAALFGEPELGEDARAVVDLLDGLPANDATTVLDGLTLLHRRMAA